MAVRTARRLLLPVALAALALLCSGPVAAQEARPDRALRATAESVRAAERVAARRAGQELLYDQFDREGSTSGWSLSEDFPSEIDEFDSYLADDFEVPDGETWQLGSLIIQGFYAVSDTVNGTFEQNETFDIVLWSDDERNPGDALVELTGVVPTYNGGGDLTSDGILFDLSGTAAAGLPLSSGRYWVTVQANLPDYLTNFTRFYWSATNVARSGAGELFHAWNYGGGFSIGVCTTGWGALPTAECGVTDDGDDGNLSFSIYGTRTRPPATLPIAEARALGVGAEVVVEGVVSRAMGSYLYFQDDTAGLAVRQTSGPLFAAIAAGDVGPGVRVRVEGTLSSIGGLLAVDEGDLAGYEVLGAEGGPAAQDVTLAELAASGEAYEAELVRVEDVVFERAGGTFAASTVYDVSDPGPPAGALVARVPGPSDSAVDGQPVPEFDATVTAVLGESAAEGYELLLVGAGDVVANPEDACTVGTARGTIGVNDVTASVFTSGSLFFSQDAPASYVVPASSGVSPVYASGVWVGGRVGGDVRVAATQYGTTDFTPGPLTDAGTPPNPADCSAYDRVWRLSRADVEAYETSGAVSADLADWPYQLGAPVLDGDGNPDNYDLAGGDRPDVLGDVSLWYVLNDVAGPRAATGTAPIGLEVRVQAFAYDEGGLDRTTFYKYTVLHKGDRPLDDAYVSVWADVDLGNGADDYVGVDVDRALGYVYNADQVDEDGYGVGPPALGYDLLQGPAVDSDGDGDVDGDDERLGLSSFVYLVRDDPDRGDPAIGEEYYEVMQGRWPDGTPLTALGTGYDTGGPETTYAFPGDPTTNEEWSEVNPGPGLPDTEPGDRRFVLSSGPFVMEPGDRQEVQFAIVFSRSNGNLSSVSLLRDHDAVVQEAYEERLRPDDPVGNTNQGPAASGTIGAQTLQVGAGDYTVSLDGLFTDPDGDALTYAASASPAGVVSAAVSGSELVVSPAGVGTATVTVTATDPDGAAASIAFAVTVEAEPPPPPVEPVVTSISVGGGAAPGASVSVSATVRDVAADGTVALRYRQPGADAYQTITPSGSSGDAYEFTLPIPGTASVGYEVDVVALNPGAPATSSRTASVDLELDGLTGQLTAGSGEGAYRLVSVPLSLHSSGRAAEDVLDELGPYDDTAWRFFSILEDGRGTVPATPDNGQSYREGGSTPFLPGVAYWLVTTAGGTFDTGGGATVPVDGPLSRAVHDGWNLLATPFDVSLPAANIRLRSGAALQTWAFGGSGWTRHPGPFEPFRGYAVFVDGDDQVSFYPFSDQADAREPSARDAAAGVAWGVRIEASAGAAADLDNEALAVEGSRAGRDPRDWAEPPPVGDYVSVAFGEPGGVPLAVDARPASDDGASWPVLVRTGARERVELRFPDLTGVPAAFGVWLVDPTSGTVADLRASGRYELASPGGGRPVPLRLVVGTEALAATEGAAAPSYRLDPAFPNPFSRSTTVRYQLPTPEHVTLEVLDPLGRRVVTLVDGPVEAGVHATEWDAAAGGLASGTYLVRIQAGSFVATRTVHFAR